MCGIVGAIAQRHVANILLEGLNRLEYRGYDSAGIAILHPKTTKIQRVRVKGKVQALAERLEKNLYGVIRALPILAGQRMENQQKKMHIPTAQRMTFPSFTMASLKITNHFDKNLQNQAMYLRRKLIPK